MNKTIKIATYGLLIALAFILSYIETLIPLNFTIPGMKLGLANLVVIVALYGMGGKEAFTLSMLRIVLVSLSFGNLSSMAFSIAGGFLSYLAMVLFKKFKLFSMTGVSIIGGVTHNIGQIVVAIFVVENINIIYHLPILLISGAVTGTLIGIVGALILNRIKKQFS